MRTPVLFLGFNRPDLTCRVLERLRNCGVTRLYVALDAPRSGNASDQELCGTIKNIIDRIDWVDEKVVLERESNLGCGRAVSSAISWFFEHVSEGIIVEDDCLPAPSFFPFCEEMLRRYLDDPRVWSVAGTSLIPDSTLPSKSHFFSKYSGIWGWATWRRAWKTYSYNLSQLNREQWCDVIARNCDNTIERRFWVHILDMMLDGKIDTWDFQVQFCSWNASALHVTSSLNLVDNLGFRADATHTREVSPLADRSIKSNPPPYENLPCIASRSLDRISFGERLEGSRELVEWLFNSANISDISNIANQQSAYIKELEEHLKMRLKIISELKETLDNQVAEINKLKKEMLKYSGIRGVFRCLGIMAK